MHDVARAVVREFFLPEFFNRISTLPSCLEPHAGCGDQWSRRRRPAALLHGRGSWTANASCRWRRSDRAHRPRPARAEDGARSLKRQDRGPRVGTPLASRSQPRRRRDAGPAHEPMRRRPTVERTEAPVEAKPSRGGNELESPRIARSWSSARAAPEAMRWRRPTASSSQATARA